METPANLSSLPTELANDQNTSSLAAIHIQEMALALFDELYSIHASSEDSRRILEIAASLYHPPFLRGKKKILRHTKELGQIPAVRALPPEKQAVLFAVLAYTQGKLGKEDSDLLKLSPVQERQAITLAALLRIAVSLDHSGSHSTNILRCEIARDGIWIVVSGPSAAADVDSAQRAARMWAKAGYLEIKILEAEEAAIQLLPFPSPQDTIGVTPDEPLAEAGRKVMRFHFAEMLRHEAGTRLGEDPEELHVMRVATRRLRASFEVFKDAFLPGALKPHLQGLRAAGRILGKVRDLDVMIQNAQDFQTASETPIDLEPLYQHWDNQRVEARAELIAYLDSQEYFAFKRKFNIFLNTPGAGACQSTGGLLSPCLVCELAPVLIYSRLAAVRAYAPHLNDAPIERLHALRIEFKKLRYTVEYFREVLGKNAPIIIDQLKRMQDHLGELNDAQVAGLIIKEFLDTVSSKSEETPSGLEGVQAYYESREKQLQLRLVTFPPEWAIFNRPAFRRTLAKAVANL